MLAFMTLRENDADPEEDEDKQSYMLIKPTKAGLIMIIMHILILLNSATLMRSVTR